MARKIGAVSLPHRALSYQPECCPVNFDRRTFSLLQILRSNESQINALPPWMIYNDATLKEIAKVMPVTMEELTELTSLAKSIVATYLSTANINQTAQNA